MPFHEWRSRKNIGHARCLKSKETDMQQFFTSRGGHRAPLRVSVLGAALTLALTAWTGMAIAADDAPAAAAKSTQAIVGMTKTASGIAIRTAQGTLTVEPWSDRIVHVRFHRNADWKGSFNPAVIGKPRDVSWKVTETPEAWTLSTSILNVRIDKTRGTLAFLDSAGKTIVEETGAQLRTVPASGSGEVAQAFSHGGATYGLGQHQGGLLDYSGNSVLLQQANRDVGVPMLVSSDGYGILWNNASVTRVDVDLPQAAWQQSIHSEAGSGIDYHFIYGPELDDVVGGYRALTGEAPMMARWTWGMWQSKERYATQEELLSVAQRYRAMKVPFDAVVQDWQYWDKGGWGSHQFDRTRYPDPAAMVKRLHDANVHTIISVWARFDLGLDTTTELDSAGALYPTVYRNVYPAGEGRWYDAFSDAGRAIYWRQIDSRLGKLGFDGWWLDASEAELGGEPGQMRDVKTAQGPGAEVYNAYPLFHTKAVYEGMRRDIPNKRAFILTRSAYAGQQRHAAITWSGDTSGNWDTFRRQVPAALNFSISGIPYWSADIGGFFGGKPSDPAYRELFVRWYQFGVFNPMFRVHGTGDGKEIWQFDADTQKILIDYDRLRYRLLPYIYSLSWDVTHNAGTMMRPLAMDFRTDQATLGIPDQYLFGKALMVAPVTQPATDVRTVYLPGKDAWFDFWSGKRFDGGHVVTAKADIGTIPVFAHAGSIVPLGPVKQYADQPSTQPVELRVYPGRDGSFMLYDDEGDGYGYEHGKYATVAITWNDSQHRLTLGERTGKYPGMTAAQVFRVVCGAAPVGGQAHNVSYAGKSVTIDMPDCTTGI
jgi:alpha-D-xyloside xylohydrolase